MLAHHETSARNCGRLLLKNLRKFRHHMSALTLPLAVNLTFPCVFTVPAEILVLPLLNFIPANPAIAKVLTLLHSYHSSMFFVKAFLLEPIVI